MDQIQEFNHRATFDNASRDRRLANVIHRLGELVAHWPEPKSPIDYLLVVPFITRLPEDIITLILSYHHLPDYDKGAILVAALEFALRDPKAALPTLESALASKDLFPLWRIKSLHTLPSVERCVRLTCDAVFTRSQSAPNACRFHLGVDSTSDRLQLATALNRHAWIGGHRRRLSEAPYTCCGIEVDNGERCRVGHHLSDFDSLLVFGLQNRAWLASSGRDAMRRVFSDEATHLAMQFVMGTDRIEMEELERGRRYTSVQSDARQ